MRKKLIKKNFVEEKFFELKKNFKNFEKKILSDKKKQFSFFILFFVFFFLSFSIILTPFENNLKEFTGNNTIFLLKLQGHNIHNQGFYENNREISYSFFVNDLKEPINIVGLCTGTLEIIILVGAILATLGISFKKKLIGIIIGIIVGIIFNLLRIFVTINIILFNNIEFAEFMHDFLFRIILFVYITGFYVVWFYFSMNGLPKKIKKILG